MRAWLLAGALCAWARAGAVNGLPAPAGPQGRWLKSYSESPVKEIWSSELTVRSMAKDLPRVVAALERAGGALTQPLSAFPSTPQDQQISVRLSRAGAARASKELARLGALGQARKAVPPALTPLGEVRQKLSLLEGESAAHRRELSGMPVISDLVDEELAYLRRVEAACSSKDGEVLWNLSVLQRP